ncbi:MAG: hypothetical protein M3021_12140 [Actinomycetota bacterium]|nr:hypothetical protein [Actinomycetota bacterium]
MCPKCPQSGQPSLNLSTVVTGLLHRRDGTGSTLRDGALYTFVTAPVPIRLYLMLRS